MVSSVAGTGTPERVTMAEVTGKSGMSVTVFDPSDATRGEFVGGDPAETVVGPSRLNAVDS